MVGGAPRPTMIAATIRPGNHIPFGGQNFGPQGRCVPQGRSTMDVREPAAFTVAVAVLQQRIRGDREVHVLDDRVHLGEWRR